MRLMTYCAALVVALASMACGGDNGPSNVFDVPSLQTTDITVGTGAQATAGRRVSVHYTGWLYDPGAAGNKGTQFDSSRTSGQPFPFVLGAGTVIRGWDQGVVGMRVGGTRTLLIPSSLGYGSSGYGPIPPNSGLVFEVELLSVQ
ncbi:MAG: FKBP-type peptidyl-prolyl cis-trans isomerase [Vicinamibacterales bacterium]